jgi:hypothetical protein
MSFTVMWRSKRWPGLEHLVVRASGDGIVADGTVIARLDGKPVCLRYAIACDAEWNAHALTVDLVGSGRRVALRAERPGMWCDAEGQPVPDLDGCVDVDLALTPFTNTLPIARIAWNPGQSRVLRVVYVAPPSYEPRAVDQRYTCLERTVDGAVFRYEAGSFRADLRVDPRGIVQDYPGLWEVVS